MTKYVMFEVKTTNYIKIAVENDEKELALLEAGQKLNEMNIATVNQEVIQTDGTIHIDRVDDWEIGECEFVNEED